MQINKKEWENEPDFDFFMIDNFPCCAVREKYSRFWCGYCGVSKDSPLYEKDYSYKIKTTSEIKEKNIDIDKIGIMNLFASAQSENEEEMSLCCVVDCHKGLTFSGTRKNPLIPEKYQSYWWFGFDCNHLGDLSPINLQDGYFSMRDVYRNLEYVKESIEEMVKDINNVENILNNCV